MNEPATNPDPTTDFEPSVLQEPVLETKAPDKAVELKEPATASVPEPKKDNKMVIVLLLLVLVALVMLIALVLYTNSNKPTETTLTPTPTMETTLVPTQTPLATTMPSGTVTPTTASETMTLKFYVFDLAKDPDVMECQAPTFVLRNLPKTSTPLTDGITYLMHSLKLTEAEKAAGLKNYFEDADHLDKLDGLSLKSANIVSNLATLTFEDLESFTSGGTCWSGILLSQVESTAKQFPTVGEVKIMPENSLFQP
jgi:hypothetical protein